MICILDAREEKQLQSCGVNAAWRTADLAAECCRVADEAVGCCRGLQIRAASLNKFAVRSRCIKKIYQKPHSGSNLYTLQIL